MVIVGMPVVTGRAFDNGKLHDQDHAGFQVA